MRSKQKYFYHISRTIKGKEVVLYPRKRGMNRGEGELITSRICVSPTIEQCITAVPFTIDEVYNVYRTKNKITGSKAKYVFDAYPCL